MLSRWAIIGLLAWTTLGCRSRPGSEQTAAAPDREATAGLCAPGPAGSSQEHCAPGSGEGAPAFETGGPAAEDARSMIAVGDVHGDVAALRRTLRAAQVIDDSDRWIGGEIALVFTGDLLNRGPQEREVLGLIRSLQEQAPTAGGEVLVLLGNHEVMNVSGDYRYVAEQGWGEWDAVTNDPRLAEVPEFARSRVAAFLPGGSVSSWLANAVVFLQRDGTLFVHGGLLPHHVEYGFERLNNETAAWIRGERHMPEILDGEESPVWTRVWSLPGQQPDCSSLAAVLDAAGVERMVVGHSVQPSGINAACNGRVWRIDAGMSEHYGGPGGALRIRGDEIEVIDAP